MHAGMKAEMIKAIGRLCPVNQKNIRFMSAIESSASGYPTLPNLHLTRL
jgi:hypothetical protein